MATAHKRMSLAERERLAAEELEALAETEVAKSAEPTPAEPTPAAPAVAAVQSPAIDDAASTPPAAPKKKRKTTQQVAKEQGKVALGLYFPEAEVLELARRAFVTDFWEHEGPDTFAEWVSQAVIAHANRTHTERARLAQPRRDRRTGVRGKLRKIDVRAEVHEAVERGLSEDRQKLRRQITVSSWCNDAVVAAIAETKARTVGELMEIDGPLPPRLRK